MTKPSMSDSTLEENIEAVLNKLHDYAAIKGDRPWKITDPYSIAEAHQALLSLYQKELVRELESLNVLRPCRENCTEAEHAYHQGTWDSQQIIDKRIHKLTPIKYLEECNRNHKTGEQS